MKAIVCERPGHFSMKEVDVPIPKSGEALVRIRRVGICGTDLHAFKGEQPYFSYPRILDHELSGEIAEINFVRSSSLAQGDLTIFFTRPLSLALLVAALLSLIFPLIRIMFVCIRGPRS